MPKHLLPSNATEHERALSGAAARLSDVPLRVREAWNPDTCPAALLPWLAWAFSVDEWDAEWTEQEKRDVIKASLSVHKHKGTIGAIGRALKPLGYLIEVVEWWQMDPPGEPYTFSVVIGSDSKAVSADLYAKAERLVLTYKNERSHLRALVIKSDTRGKFYAGAAMVDGQETTVWPYQVRELKLESTLHVAVAGQDVASATVYPQAQPVEIAQEVTRAALLHSR